MAEEFILKRQFNNATEGQVLLPRGVSRRSKKIDHQTSEKMIENNFLDVHEDSDIDLSEEEDRKEKKRNSAAPEPLVSKKTDVTPIKLDIIAEEDASNLGYGFDENINYEELTGSMIANDLVIKEADKRISAIAEKTKAVSALPGLRRQATRDSKAGKNFEAEVVEKSGRRTNV